MTTEQIKEHLLANFCDGDSWEDAKADRFTHEGALEIAKYFHDEGFKAGIEHNNPTVEGTEIFAKWETEFDLVISLSPTVHDDADIHNVEIKDFIRKTIQSTRADERKKLVKVVKGMERHSWDSGIYNKALEDVLAKISQVWHLNRH